MITLRTYDECYFVNYDQFTDLQLYEIGRQACPPSYSYGPTIRNHYIFHYLFSGKGSLYLNGHHYTISAHQGFLISPNSLAYYEADRINPWHYAWLHLDGPKATEFFQMAGLSIDQPIFMPTQYPNSIDNIMTNLLLNNERELYCIGNVYELFDCITELSTTKFPKRVNPQLAYIKRIIDFICIKYSEPIHMDDIAHACGLERSYMTRLFKDATGRTPQEYLMTYRMKEACKMLQQDNISIQNISYSVGYGDSFTFSKAFKRHIGCSPSQYRLTEHKKKP
ncbi:MAG: AraC family transcriptional regulator [bacterium]|nr:AraC family transcriptional regulator [bacterium]